ncbi:hypothetical protein MNAN1_001902 [Malassezia nana]|uniref:Pre-rRNA-processing protein RIX1 N-terminal domain-containing protein n=1 Tax=Malassezia nana TaxID=180528 RepID=A0AAF0EM61_9BASI|nr:hypothetical protein MNAN1_001902 [Malassezia nana]
MPSPLLEPLLAALDADAHCDAALWCAASDQQIRATLLEGDVDSLSMLEKHLTQRLHTPVAANEGPTPPWHVAARLMSLVLSQAGWHMAETHGAAWLQRTHAHLEQVAQRLRTSPGSAALDAVAELAAFLMQDIMGRESTAHPEFHRVIVAPWIGKWGQAVVAVVESATAAGPAPGMVPGIVSLLDALSLHVELYASTYRTLTSSIHALCMRLLFAPLAPATAEAAPVPDALARSATHLLASLHLTGAITSEAAILSSSASGKVSQAQLWAATLTEMLDAAMMAACNSVPSMDWHVLGVQVALAQPGALAWEWPSSDYYQAIPTSVRRCEHLLGAATSGSMGMVPLFLTVPTLRAVPVPLSRCLLLAHALMQAHSSSRATVDQARLEAYAAPKLRIMGTQFLVQLVLAFREVTWPLLHGSSVLSTLCTMAETERGMVRLVAVRALHVLLSRGEHGVNRLPGAGVPLDPASTLAQRIARVAIQPLSELLVLEPVLWASDGARKRSRTFDSDAISRVGRASQDAVLAKPLLAWDLAGAGAALFLSVFSSMSTSAAPGHRDLARAGALALLGTCEAVVSARLMDAAAPTHVESAALFVRALCQLILGHASALVSHLLARVHAVFTYGSHSSSPVLSAACEDALLCLRTVIRPRAPPLVDAVDSSALEERIDADGTDQIPMPLPGWRGSAAAAIEAGHVSTAVPVVAEAEPRQEALAAEAEPRREAPAAEPRLVSSQPREASAPKAPAPVPPCPAPALPETDVCPAPMSERSVPPMPDAIAVDSDDEALPELHMDDSDDEVTS